MRKSLEVRNAHYYDSVDGCIDLYLTSRGWSAVFATDVIMLVHAASLCGVLAKVARLKQDTSDFADYRPEEKRWVVRPEENTE